MVYQKYIGTSINVGGATLILYASSGLKAERVPANNQTGRGSGPCRLRDTYLEKILGISLPV